MPSASSSLNRDVFRTITRAGSVLWCVLYARKEVLDDLTGVLAGHVRIRRNRSHST